MQVKNRDRDHDFRAVGIEQIEGYTLADVKCSICGEERTIGAPIGEVNRLGGCVRLGRDEPWQAGDLLVRDGGYLDSYVETLPDGRILTYNAGGHYHQSTRDQLRAAD